MTTGELKVQAPAVNEKPEPEKVIVSPIEPEVGISVTLAVACTFSAEANNAKRTMNKVTVSLMRRRVVKSRHTSLSIVV